MLTSAMASSEVRPFSSIRDEISCKQSSVWLFGLGTNSGENRILDVMINFDVDAVFWEFDLFEVNTGVGFDGTNSNLSLLLI